MITHAHRDGMRAHAHWHVYPISRRPVLLRSVGSILRFLYRAFIILAIFATVIVLGGFLLAWWLEGKLW